MSESTPRFIAPFNGPVEIGLRSLAILCEAYPSSCSLQRLIVFDYLVVHSDDLPGGPPGLHPKTPQRSGELLVRRELLQQGLLLYMSRGLIERRYGPAGVAYSATEATGAFLDALKSEYLASLRLRSTWVVDALGTSLDEQLNLLVREHLGDWGAEFEMESVLWGGTTP